MAVGLEFYFDEERTPANFAGAYATFLTCTANRTGRAGAKNFFIIAHISTTVDNVDTQGMVRLQVDGADYGECADGLTHIDTSPEGFTYNFMKRLSLDASSHSITLDCGRVAGANNFVAENASIAVLEESAAAEYAENEVEAGSGAGVKVSFMNLQFTPASTQNYIILWSCETKAEDESDFGVESISFEETEQALGVLQNENHAELVAAANDNVYRTSAGMVVKELTPASYTFHIYMHGDGVDDEIYCNKGYIIAIPVGDFENVYTDQNTQKTFHQGAAFSDSEAVLAAQACNAADHLIIASAMSANESWTMAGYWRLNFDNSVFFPAYQFEERDEDSEHYFCSFVVYGATLAAQNYDIELEGNSEAIGPDAEGCLETRTYLAVCEIPPAPTVGRRIYITHW